MYERLSMAISIRDKNLTSRFVDKSVPELPKESPKETPNEPMVSQADYDALLKAYGELANNNSELIKMVEMQIQAMAAYKKPSTNVIATIKRDKQGRMEAIIIK